MQLILVLVFGVMVGVLGHVMLPGQKPGGWVVSIAVGVLGAFAAGYLRLWGLYREGEPVAFILSLVGAAAFVGIFYGIATIVRRSRARQRPANAR
jgi:uncharacterized membrane protein YeaQ/YmgE (transglycosylase-associated protein family)